MPVGLRCAGAILLLFLCSCWSWDRFNPADGDRDADVGDASDADGDRDADVEPDAETVPDSDRLPDADSTVDTDGDDDGGDSGPTGYAGEVLADAPVAYYRLGEGTQPTAFDSSGNGHHGDFLRVTLGATGAIAGDSDTAASFSGDGRVEIDATALRFDGVQPFTIEVWARLDVDEVVAICGCATYDGGTGYEGYVLAAALTDPRASRLPSGGFVEGGTLTLGEFAHIVFVYDGAQLRFYINGVRVDSESSLGEIPPHEGDFMIGDAAGWGNFVGVLDEVAVYDYPLSPTRIYDHYAAGLGDGG